MNVGKAMLSFPALDAALELAAQMGEEGLQVAAYVDGELVADVSMGLADRETGREVDAETIFPVFSVTKAVAATAIHLQAERGLLDYEDPIAKHWPEFAVNGKQPITIRHVLTHRAGLPQMPEGVTPELMCDWDWMVDQIQELEPLWEPGSRNSYLALTFGWLLGEVVRRTDPARRPFGQFVSEELFGPLGVDSFFVGLPDTERSRVATLYSESATRKPPPAAPYNTLALPPQVAPSPQIFNRPDVQAACIPAANGIGNARSVARFFALLANLGELDGTRLLSAQRVRACTQLRDDPYQPDEVIGRPPLVGLGGYFVGGEYPPGEPLPGSGPHVLCQPGGGQSIAWADLDRRLSVAICHNRMFGNIPPREPAAHPLYAIGEAIRAET